MSDDATKPKEDDAPADGDDAPAGDDDAPAAIDDANAVDGAEADDDAKDVDDPTTDDDASGRDAIFEALWARVLEAWDEDKPHEAALSYALSNELLPEIAGRYRALKDDPDKGARAQRKIDGIVVAATQLMFATKTPPQTKVPWQWTASAAVMFAFVMALLAYKLFLRR